MAGLESVKWELEKIREDLSVFRKKGIDTMVLGMKALQIPPKIQMAAATEEKKDVQRAEKMVNELQKEVNSLAEHNGVLAALCEQRVMQTKEALGKKDVELACYLYNQLREYYPRLKADEKQELSKSVKDIVKRMLEVGEIKMEEGVL